LRMSEMKKDIHTVYACTLPFNSLGSVRFLMFLKEVSYMHIPRLHLFD